MTSSYGTPRGGGQANLWEDWTNLLLGIWLFVSPWVFQLPNDSVVAWNAWIFGGIIAVIAAAALYQSTEVGGMDQCHSWHLDRQLTMGLGLQPRSGEHGERGDRWSPRSLRRRVGAVRPSRSENAALMPSVQYAPHSRPA